MSASAQLKQLVGVAQQRTPETRSALLRGITEIFISPGARFHAAEIRHFDAILSRLAELGPADERRALADTLAGCECALPALINQLARDDASIAEPVLRCSTALADADLIAIIRQRGEAHRKAIARRRALSQTVTQALVELGGEDTLVALAKNQGALFSPETLHALTQKARRAPELQAPMTARYDLPPLILTQLYFFVPGPLKNDILARADMLDPSLIDAAETTNRHKLYRQAQSGADLSEPRRFIAEKIAAGAINESLLKTLITERRPTEFLYAFAYITGVDFAAAQAIVKDKNFEALALACRAAGLERQSFARIVMSQRSAAGDQSKALRILDLYVKISQDCAERMMRFWRMGAGAAAQATRPHSSESHFKTGHEPLELRNRADGG